MKNGLVVIRYLKIWVFIYKFIDKGHCQLIVFLSWTVLPWVALIKHLVSRPIVSCDRKNIDADRTTIPPAHNIKNKVVAHSIIPFSLRTSFVFFSPIWINVSDLEKSFV